MRIAYIINSVDRAGAELAALPVIALMRESGAHVRLLALSRRTGGLIPDLEAAGIDFRVCDAGRSHHLRAGRWLIRALEDFQPDLLWTSLTRATVLGQVAGAILRKPVVSWQHNVFLKPANAALLRVTRALTHYWVADSEAVAAVSRARLGLEAARLGVWPLFAADPAAPRAHSRAAGTPFRLGSLGRLHPTKGFDVLIDALALIDNERLLPAGSFTVTIAGEGPEQRALLARARAKGVATFLLAGYQSDARPFLAGLHGYIQPSRVEGFCIAAHEAMQAGLPVIATDVGEMGVSVRESGGGITVPPDDARALAKAICTLVSDADRAAAMGESAWHFVHSRFSAQTFRAAGHAALATARLLAA